MHRYELYIKKKVTFKEDNGPHNLLSVYGCK